MERFVLHHKKNGLNYSEDYYFVIKVQLHVEKSDMVEITPTRVFQFVLCRAEQQREVSMCDMNAIIMDF